nr:hypothetical protein [Tanacetum cinerariifolium]
MKIIVGRCTALLCNNVIQSRIFPSCFSASFRSTPSSFEKWNNKWTNSSSDLGGQKPSKGEFLKRHETKSWEDSFDTTDYKKKRDPQKASARRATKANQKRNKSKSKKGSIYDDFDDPGMHFRATFGNRQHSWSFQSWEESFYQSQTSGFKWREEPDRRNKWRTISDDESDEDDDQPSVIGSHSDRTALGLPINGPLKIEDVKIAFRLSALKWHPDKHQGPSQALAEEKFKCKQGVPSLHVKDRRCMLKLESKWANRIKRAWSSELCLVLLLGVRPNLRDTIP